MITEIMRKKVLKKETFLVDKKKVDLEMCQVESSNIESVGLTNQGGKGELNLVVKFHSGGVYLYKGVEAVKADEMVTAASVGSWFDKNIRFNKVYPAVKIEMAKS